MQLKHLIDGDMWNRVFIRNHDVVSRKIAGELFLVPVRGRVADMEKIFTLTGVAAFIWERLNGQRSLNDLKAEVLSHFDVSEERTCSDMEEFIAELMEAGLVHEAESVNEVC